MPDDEEEASKHRRCSLFIPSPSDVMTDAEGRYIVDHVTFTFAGLDEEEITESWDQSKDLALRSHLDILVGEYFGRTSAEDRALGRQRIEEVSTQITTAMQNLFQSNIQPVSSHHYTIFTRLLGERYRAIAQVGSRCWISSLGKTCIGLKDLSKKSASSR